MKLAKQFGLIVLFSAFTAVWLFGLSLAYDAHYKQGMMLAYISAAKNCKAQDRGT